MDSSFHRKTDFDSSLPPPPGVDIEEHRRPDKYESRSRSRDYDRDRSRRDRVRETRFDRDYREEAKDGESSRSRTKDTDSRYDRRGYRDRSRDRERDRSRDRDRSRERMKDRPRDRSRGDSEFNFREDIPNSTILIKGLPPNVTEEDIRIEINRFTLYPLEITVKKRKGTNESRGFAFVEFRMLSDAVRWKELTQGEVYFGQVRTTLHYFVPRDAPDRLGPVRLDWACIKCGLNNFKKREFCFKCNAPREESELSAVGEGCEEVGKNPSSTLLFRNLDILTTEERVLSMLGQITVLPIKNLKVAKDSLTNTSRGFAFVELHSVSEAMQLYELLMSMTGNFFVDGRRVTVSYSRQALSTMNSTASANAANIALAAAQWSNQSIEYETENKGMFSDSVIRGKHMESVQSLNAGFSNQFQNTSTPDVSGYQYDESSGYYFDSTTGYYYDSNSQYYYNSTSQQYLYWDLEKQKYMVVPSNDTSVVSAAAVIHAAPAIKTEKSTEAVITSPPVIAHAPVLNKKSEVDEKSKEKINPQDKVKIAKKVAKDMEKWAKTLNQKKENNKFNANFVQKPVVEPFTKTIETPIISQARVSDMYIEDDIKDVEAFLSKNGNTIKSESKDVSGLVAAYGGESDSDGERDYQDEGTKACELLKSEEAKLIDWSKLACLLCKRQFPSKDVLTKHVQLSDLHKQNIDMLKLTKLTPRQLQELEKKESGYRDRAKERRQKFGQPDAPPPSRLKTKYMKERTESIIVPEQPVEALGSDNIGNKMLKAMGWSEGQGLGKSGQGMSGIIEVQRRVKSAGLGMKGSSYGASASDSYKDAVRKSMQQRYNDIAQ